MNILPIILTILAYNVRTEEELDPNHEKYAKPVEMSNSLLLEKLDQQPSSLEFESNYFSLEIKDTQYSLNASRIDDDEWSLFVYIYLDKRLVGRFEGPCSHSKVKEIFASFNQKGDLHSELAIGKYDVFLDKLQSRFNIKMEFYPIDDIRITKIRILTSSIMKIAIYSIPIIILILLLMFLFAN